MVTSSRSRADDMETVHQGVMGQQCTGSSILPPCWKYFPQVMRGLLSAGTGTGCTMAVQLSQGTQETKNRLSPSPPSSSVGSVGPAPGSLPHRSGNPPGACPRSSGNSSRSHPPGLLYGKRGRCHIHHLLSPDASPQLRYAVGRPNSGVEKGQEEITFCLFFPTQEAGNVHIHRQPYIGLARERK